MSEKPSPDELFFDRAGAVIRLANEQAREIDSNTVSASLMYAAARFQASLSAQWVDSAEEMKVRRPEIVDYFVDQYRRMLIENVDDHIEHYAVYMKPRR